MFFTFNILEVFRVEFLKIVVIYFQQNFTFRFMVPYIVTITLKTNAN